MISDDVQALLQYVDEQSKAFVIQRYINNPFLLEGGRKFDIRYCMKVLYIIVMLHGIL